MTSIEHETQRIRAIYSRMAHLSQSYRQRPYVLHLEADALMSELTRLTARFVPFQDNHDLIQGIVSDYDMIRKGYS